MASKGGLVKGLVLAAAICAVACGLAILHLQTSNASASSAATHAESASRDANWSASQVGYAVGQADSESAYETVVAADGVECVAHRVLIVVDGGLTQEDVQARLAEAGVDVRAIELVSNTLEGNDVLLGVEYAGSEDPAEQAARLASCAFVKSAATDAVATLCEDAAADVTSSGEDAALQDVTSSGADSVSQDASAREAEAAANVESSAQSTDATLSAEVNDPSYSQQWGMQAINAATAWDIVKANGTVTVATIDSGVDYDHPDLAANLLLDYAKNVTTGATGGTAVDDEVGHGTHVAGIISAVSNNGVGVTGVTYNAKLLPIKATHLNTSGSHTISVTHLVESLDYITGLKTDASSSSALKNLRVINMSLTLTSYDENFEQAVQRAQNAGLLIVAATGNASTDVGYYPASFDGVMGVSALKQSGENIVFDSSYSNYGASVDISAPGTSVYSTYAASLGAQTGYASLQGTSMAAPHVSGAAALLCAADADITTDELVQALEENAVDLGDAGRDDYYGYGMLDVQAAVLSHMNATSLKTAIVTAPVQQAYTGYAVTPSVTVTLGGTVLTEGTDYTVSYSNNVNVGTATVTVTGTLKKGGYYGSAQTTFAIVSVGNEIAGANRYATASQIAQAAYPNGAKGVIVATGKNFPDALGAAGLAGMYDYPIILTDSSALSDDAAEAISALGATKAIVIGGANAVSESVIANMQALGVIDITRLAGVDRFNTAELIYSLGATEGAWGDTAIIATGLKYPDALSISGYAFSTKSPIFLCGASGDGNVQLTEAAKEYLAAGGFEQIIIVGGETAVSAETQTWLENNAVQGADHVTRLSGADRYETSQKIARYAISQGASSNNACIATGLDFPDALAGSPFVAKNNTVLLLACTDNTTAFSVLSDYAEGITTINYLGGIKALPDTVRIAALHAAGL